MPIRRRSGFIVARGVTLGDLANSSRSIRGVKAYHAREALSSTGAHPSQADRLERGDLVTKRRRIHEQLEADRH
jgi:hypothetical protein